MHVESHILGFALEIDAHRLSHKSWFVWRGEAMYFESQIPVFL